MSSTKWIVEWSPNALKNIRKLDPQSRSLIRHYVGEKVALSTNPRRFGKPLTNNLAGLWRYRVQDYRIVCEIRDHKLVVLVVTVGHRRNVYS